MVIIVSVVVTICLKDCIIMAADSRTTLTYIRDGHEEIRHKDGIQKIFMYRNLGILWYGNARVGKEPVSHFLDHLFKQLPDRFNMYG